MMKTPICDFVRQYAHRDVQRLHMPGHKGQGSLGCESLDITEIPGADSLYEADGIIRQSEENAASLFGCPTFYSTEGASQCIRTMVHLAALDAKARGKQPLIAAGRNAHKSFLTAVALLDVPVHWLYGQGGYLSCDLTPEALEAVFAQCSPTAVYLTSPDYLGKMAQIQALAAVCHRHDALLLVDNAHGAYLRFLPQSLHPMDLGADLCCTSAHKTLPVLTGGAYLHVRPEFAPQVRDGMALFGSTSPSYLILQSLDACNAYLCRYPEKLKGFLPRIAAVKEALLQKGWQLYGQEPLKLTLMPKSKGLTGAALAELLAQKGVICEFADPDFCVMMFTPEIAPEAILEALAGLPTGAPLEGKAPGVCCCPQMITPRQAMLSPNCQVPVDRALGQVLASPSVGCPPAVPIVMCGERITEEALEAFHYYGITHCRIVK